MKKISLVVLLLFLPFVFGANVTYTIVGEKTLVEIEMNQTEIDLFEFPEDFEYSEGKIKYVDKGLIEKSGQEYFFISKSEILSHSKTKVILPEGAYSNENYFIFPKNYKLSTNGQNIILEWQNSGEKEILVPYKINSGKNYWLYYLIVALILTGVYFYFKNKDKEKKYTQNLFREEKRIINYLLKNREVWTKELVKDLNISKVRLSRKLRKLEEKGLIEKIPFGNENKIKLKK